MVGATGTTTLSTACVVADVDTVRLDLAAADTTGLDLGGRATGLPVAHAWDWEIEASKGAERNTLIGGAMTVLRDLRTA